MTHQKWRAMGLQRVMCKVHSSLPHPPPPFAALEAGGLGDLPKPDLDQYKVAMFPSGLTACHPASQLTQCYMHISISSYNFFLCRRYFLNSPAVPFPSEISWQVSFSFEVAIWKVKQVDIVPLKYHSIRSFVIHTT